MCKNDEPNESIHIALPSYATVTPRRVSRWLITWVLLSGALCLPIALLNLAFPLAPAVVDRFIARDVEYAGPVIAAGVFLNQLLLAAYLLYFSQFPETRLRIVLSLAFTVVLAALVLRGLLMLSEQYVSIH